jgi:hypothetical protein
MPETEGWTRSAKNPIRLELHEACRVCRDHLDLNEVWLRKTSNPPPDGVAEHTASEARQLPKRLSELAIGAPAERLDWRPQRPTITSGSGTVFRVVGSILPAESGTSHQLRRPEALLRGPTGIVGLIVTVLVIYLILRLLGVL